MKALVIGAGGVGGLGHRSGDLVVGHHGGQTHPAGKALVGPHVVVLQVHRPQAGVTPRQAVALAVGVEQAPLGHPVDQVGDLVGVAFQAGRADAGYVRPGAVADLVWLAQDPRAVDPMTIGAIPVRGTWFRGRRTFHG